MLVGSLYQYSTSVNYNNTFSAGPCGTVVAIFVTGYISASSYGWPLVFYLAGALGFLWVIIFTFFSYDSPAEHPRISTAEKLYIEKGLGHTDEKAVSLWL